MLNIILASFNSFAKNIELALIIFTVNVVAKYFLSVFDKAHFLYILGIVIFNIFIMSATVQALIKANSDGRWTWKEYFEGGRNSFLFVFVWLLIIMGAVNLLNLIFSKTPLNDIRKFSIVYFWVAVYCSAFIPVAKISGKNLIESLKSQLGIIHKKTIRWILGGVYLYILIFLTFLVIMNIWNMAASVASPVTRLFYVLLGEFARSCAIVVILSTLTEMHADYVMDEEILI